jgi:hypothetical protein
LTLKPGVTLEDARHKVLSLKLATEVHEDKLRTQAMELVDRERQLTERQMWELATT